MKIIDRSPWGGVSSSLSFFDRIRGICRFGLSWERDLQAQQVFLEGLQNRLDNAHTAVCNMTLPGMKIPIPRILVSPAGIFTILGSSLRGIYRAKDDTWSVLEGRSNQYTPAWPNLVRRASILSRAVHNYLTLQGRQYARGEAVLFFANPEVHVEAVHPTARIVQSDGIDQFVSSLVQAENILNSSDISWIASTLARAQSTRSHATTPIPKRKHPLKLVGVGHIRMRPWQWFVLGLLTLATVSVMLAIVSVVAENFVF